MTTPISGNLHMGIFHGDDDASWLEKGDMSIGTYGIRSWKWWWLVIKRGHFHDVDEWSHPPNTKHHLDDPYYVENPS